MSNANFYRCLNCAFHHLPHPCTLPPQKCEECDQNGHKTEECEAAATAWAQVTAMSATRPTTVALSAGHTSFAHLMNSVDGNLAAARSLLGASNTEQSVVQRHGSKRPFEAQDWASTGEGLSNTRKQARLTASNAIPLGSTAPVGLSRGERKRRNKRAREAAQAKEALLMEECSVRLALEEARVRLAQVQERAALERASAREFAQPRLTAMVHVKQEFEDEDEEVELIELSPTHTPGANSLRTNGSSEPAQAHLKAEVHVKPELDEELDEELEEGELIELLPRYTPEALPLRPNGSMSVVRPRVTELSPRSFAMPVLMEGRSGTVSNSGAASIIHGNTPAPDGRSTNVPSMESLLATALDAQRRLRPVLGDTQETFLRNLKYHMEQVLLQHIPNVPGKPPRVVVLEFWQYVDAKGGLGLLLKQDNAERRTDSFLSTLTV